MDKTPPSSDKKIRPATDVAHDDEIVVQDSNKRQKR